MHVVAMNAEPAAVLTLGFSLSLRPRACTYCPSAVDRAEEPTSTAQLSLLAGTDCGQESQFEVASRDGMQC